MRKQVFTSKYDFVATIIAIGLGILMIYSKFQGPKLQSQSDTTEIIGHLKNYSFKHLPSGGRTGTVKQYYIWLDEYPCTFQIKADYLPIFDQSTFLVKVNLGDKLKVTIPKEYENRLSKQDEFIFITSLSSLSTDYLRIENTIKKENDNFYFYLGILFIVGALIYYFLKRSRII